MTVENIIEKLLGDISEAINLHGEGGDLSWSGISSIATCLNASAAQLTLKADVVVPFGRYLIHKDSNFNIQLDVFSENYVGAPHNHDTWGVLGVITGILAVTDYQLAADSLVTLRKSILPSGSVSGFKAFEDWHSTETFALPQVASFHVYGASFDLDNGKRYVEKSGIEEYARGPLNTIDEALNYLVARG